MQRHLGRFNDGKHRGLILHFDLRLFHGLRQGIIDIRRQDVFGLKTLAARIHRLQHHIYVPVVVVRQRLLRRIILFPGLVIARPDEIKIFLCLTGVIIHNITLQAAHDQFGHLCRHDRVLDLDADHDDFAVAARQSAIGRTYNL